MKRHIGVVLIAILFLLLESCGGDSSTKLQSSNTPAPTIEMTAAERAALAAGDESKLPVPQFGDADLGQVSYEAPPSATLVANLQDKLFAPAGKGASTANSCNNPPPCNTPPPCDPPKVKGICNISERFWKVADCCDKTADVTYGAHVLFDQNGTGDLSGIEVIFKRDGQEVGRANTGNDGVATFTEKDVPRGTHSIMVCVADTATAPNGCPPPPPPTPCPPPPPPPCTTPPPPCTPPTPPCTTPPPPCNPPTPPCTTPPPPPPCKPPAPPTCKPPKHIPPPPCNNNDKDHKDKSKDKDKDKKGSNSRCASAVAGGSTGGDNTGGSSCTTPPPCNTPPPPSCGCAGDNACTPCVTVAENGFYCSSIDFAVYRDCISGAITGTGYFPTCNPLRVGLRDGMNFRIAYDNGAVQGYINFSDGPSSSWKLDNAQVKWALIEGTESWFGGDNFLVHVKDGGGNFTDDFFEIWLSDPATCTCYHCGGNLTGCYVHVSYKYTQTCP